MDIYTANTAYINTIIGDHDVQWLQVTYPDGPSPYTPDEGLMNAFRRKEISNRDFFECYVQRMKMSYYENKDCWINLLGGKRNWHYKPLVVFCDMPKDRSLRQMWVDVALVVAKYNKLTLNYLGEFPVQ
jgi:hypothetical protein